MFYQVCDSMNTGGFKLSWFYFETLCLRIQVSVCWAGRGLVWVNREGYILLPFVFACGGVGMCEITEGWVHVYSVISGWTCLMGVGWLALTCTGMKTNPAQSWERRETTALLLVLKNKEENSYSPTNTSGKDSGRRNPGSKEKLFWKEKRKRFKMWNNPEAIVLLRCDQWVRDSNVAF